MNSHVNAIAGRLSLRAPQRRSLEILDRITEIVPLEKANASRGDAEIAEKLQAIFVQFRSCAVACDSSRFTRILSAVRGGPILPSHGTARHHLP